MHTYMHVRVLCVVRTCVWKEGSKVGRKAERNEGKDKGWMDGKEGRTNG